MKNNILNKNLIIYKIHNITQKNYFLLILTLKYGFLLYDLKKNKNQQLNEILFGYNKLYKFFFKLKGFGYKWKYILNLKKTKKTVYFKLGYTHRIVLITKNDLKCKLKKKRFVIQNRSYFFIRNNLNLLFFLYKTYLYNKKGIYLRGTKFKLKISKKKAKF